MQKIEIPLPISDQVADAIRKGVLTGEFKPGQKISVSMMCSLLNVSATPVKEAFKMLQAEGLLETIPRSGTRISDFAKRSLGDTALIRSALEGAAAFIAAQEATEEDIKGMEVILQEADQAVSEGNVDQLAALNTRFHKQLRESTHNSYLILLIDRLVSFDYTFRHTALTSISERTRGKQEHWKILQHIKDGNSEAAEAALINHIRRSSTTVVTRTGARNENN